MTVTSREGVKRPYDFNRILVAIQGAFRDCDIHEVPVDFIEAVKAHFESFGLDHDFHVEEIQDMIQLLLMKHRYYKTAEAFITYRRDHENLRFMRERSDYMKAYRDSTKNAASSSETDANANVAIKNVANLNGEFYKTQNRKQQRYLMMEKLKEMFPEHADQYHRDLESHIIYGHDEASFPMPTNYCEAVSLWPFLMEGSSSMDGLGANPPHNLSSFCGQFANLAFLLTAQCKGAVAFSEFLLCFNYFCIKDFGEDYHKKMDELASIYPKRTIGELIGQYFQAIIYSINQPAGNRSYQSPFTNISYFDKGYFKALFETFKYPDGTVPKWEHVDFIQRFFMKWFNNERTKVMLTFPVETMALLSDGKDIIDKEYKDFTAEMYAEGHSFFTYISNNPNALASCCRLRNEIHENVFSFTNGLTGVQTGSVNVITLNFNRITQDWARKNGFDRAYLKEHFREHADSYTDYIKDILERVYCYHIAYKTLVYEIEEAGLLTASNAGYISISKLYSTIGENGVNEAAEFLGMKCSYNEDYKYFCRLITGTISEQNALHSKDRRFLFNQEFVPAEGLGSKNYNWDKADGYWVPEGRVLYNSYFYLADDPETSVLDKFRLHGREFTELLDGGVGLHCNLGEHMSKEQYLKMLDFAVANGTSYFTFNVPNSECTNKACHHIVKKPLAVCPKCGARMRPWTRVIGYLRPVENFDLFRGLEAGKRHYEKDFGFMEEMSTNN